MNELLNMVNSYFDARPDQQVDYNDKKLTAHFTKNHSSVTTWVYCIHGY